jgi:hypothetical protein
MNKNAINPDASNVVIHGICITPKITVLQKLANKAEIKKYSPPTNSIKKVVRAERPFIIEESNILEFISD